MSSATKLVVANYAIEFDAQYRKRALGTGASVSEPRLIKVRDRQDQEIGISQDVAGEVRVDDSVFS
jgi:hypothetical protein